MIWVRVFEFVFVISGVKVSDDSLCDVVDVCGSFCEVCVIHSTNGFAVCLDDSVVDVFGIL